MWYYVAGAVAAKVVYSRVKKAWLKYRAEKELKGYGESVKIPFVPGENVDDYRKRLIDARNRNSGTK